jgi:hypothetical protein
MADLQCYQWDDSCPHLGFMIVRIGERYEIINDDLSLYFDGEHHESIDSAKRAIDRLYLEGVMFDLLIAAQNKGVITDQQQEQLMEVFDNRSPKLPISCNGLYTTGDRRIAPQD